MRHSSILLIFILCVVLSFLLFSCVTAPSSPYDIAKTKISIDVKSSAGIHGESNIEDTVGNNVWIGAYCNWWNYVDSIQFRQIAQTSTSLKDSMIGLKTKISTLEYNDTIWQSVVFNETGTKLIKAMAYLNDGRIISDSVAISIYPKTAINHSPSWQQDTIRLACPVGNTITLKLSDKSFDIDDDTLAYALLFGLPQADTIIASVYSFTPSIADTGVLFPRIAAIDPKGGSDTLVLRLTVTSTDTALPSKLDSLGPMFKQLSGPITGDTVKDSIVTIIDSIFDPSGVDSVCWSLNGSIRKVLIYQANHDYLLKDTLKTYHVNRLVIYAQDKSNQCNKDSAVISLDFNITPVINDTIVSTGKNAVLTCTLHAQSVDADPLTWSMVSSLSAASGNISGTLPVITFMPATDWIGADSFRVRVTDGKWSDTAKIKITVFSVQVGPKDVKIITHPASDSIMSGQSISFSATMNSDINPTPTFQWNHNGTAISGATGLSYTIGTILLKDTGSYTVTVTNSIGSMTSPAFVLKVLVAPSITTQPNSATKCSGETVNFNVSATGTLPFSYQWKKDGVNAAGSANAASYSIASIDTSYTGIYTCSISNTYGNIVTWPCTLYVNVPISIIEHPVSTIKWAGDTVVFSVKATGSGPLAYQWKRGNANIVEATSASYTISGINYYVDNDATYSCVVSNTCGSKTSNTATLTINAVKMAAGGDEHSLILKTDGTLWVCGTNESGQLGTGDTISRLKPVQIMAGVTGVACGDESSFIIKSDGSLLACGYNFFGTLGLNDTNNRLTPVPILQGVTAVAAGDAHCLIIKTDNTLYGCGYNGNGQLGLGDIIDRWKPTYITDNVANIAAGGDHSLILKKDGALLACGYNCFGVLGDGTTQDSHTPMQIKTGVTNMAISNYHSLILTTNRTVLSSGDNSHGQLGDGTTQERHLPVQISTLTDVIKIATGSAYSLALKADGTLWTFGSNFSGELGDGTTQDRYVPVQVNTNVSLFTSCDAHSLIVKADGSLWGCGQNLYGQLGDETTTDHHNWVQIKF